MESENNGLVNNPAPGKETVGQADYSKSTRWIGIIAIVLFFVFGGLGHCPWYLWIVFGLLALLTFAGVYKGGQALFGLVLLIWGTSLFGSDDNAYYDSSQSSSSAIQYNSSSTQTESERREIEGKIRLIESLQAQFERADRMGAPDYELKRISDEAWQINQSLEKMNLTKEQRMRLSNLFAL